MPLPLVPVAFGLAEAVTLVSAAVGGFWTWMMVSTATDSIENITMPIISAVQQDEPDKEESELKNFAGIVSTGLAVAVVFTGYKLLQKVAKSL